MIRSNAIIVAIAGVVAAGIANTAVQAADSTRVQFALEVAVGKIAEECRKVGAGQRIAYSFESAAPMDFNIHYHRGNDVAYPVKQDAVQRADATFTAETAEEYCWMWSNRSTAPIRISGWLDSAVP